VTNRTHLFRQLLARDDTYVRDGRAYRRMCEGDAGSPIYVQVGDRYALVLPGDGTVADVVPPSTRYAMPGRETTYV